MQTMSVVKVTVAQETDGSSGGKAASRALTTVLGLGGAVSRGSRSPVSARETGVM